LKSYRAAENMAAGGEENRLRRRASILLCIEKWRIARNRLARQTSGGRKRILWPWLSRCSWRLAGGVAAVIGAEGAISEEGMKRSRSGVAWRNQKAASAVEGVHRKAIRKRKLT